MSKLLGQIPDMADKPCVCIQAELPGHARWRKARPCSKTAGAWAGAIVHVLDTLGICVLTSKEKWLKMKGILKKWLASLAAWGPCNRATPKLSHKDLSADRGFLVYVTRTYPTMVPYPKGFHLTIKMWQGGRVAEKWKLKDGDEASICLDNSLSSLDVTQAGSHGLNLDLASTYTASLVQDENTAAMNHWVSKKLGREHVYPPTDGLTVPLARLKDDVVALLRLTNLSYFHCEWFVILGML